MAEIGDKVVGASDQGPILIAGQRGTYKFVAMGFDVRDTDLTLRIAWPLLLLNSINWFTDEDSQYISSFKTGDVWRVPVISTNGQAKLTQPDKAEVIVPVHEGRAVYLGERAGFYQLSGTQEGEVGVPDPKAQAGMKTAFAANLLDSEESAIEPAKELVIDGRKAGELGGFQIGVRREIWIYLLIAALVLTAVEWITYHRRLTV